MPYSRTRAGLLRGTVLVQRREVVCPRCMPAASHHAQLRTTTHLFQHENPQEFMETLGAVVFLVGDGSSQGSRYPRPVSLLVSPTILSFNRRGYASMSSPTQMEAGFQAHEIRGDGTGRRLVTSYNNKSMYESLLRPLILYGLNSRNEDTCWFSYFTSTVLGNGVPATPPALP